ncbi:TPA: hypothetical protein ACF58N_003290 [Legionella pneumophila]
MKILKTLSLLMGVILAVSQLQGCAVAAIGAVKYANAKKAEAKEGCHKNYNEYLRVAKKPIPLSEYCSEK